MGYQVGQLLRGRLRLPAATLVLFVAVGCSSAPPAVAPSAGAPSAGAVACDPNASITAVAYKGVSGVLDPTKNVGAVDPDMPMVYDSLIRADQAGKIMPWLATAWKWSSPTTLDLTLRQDVVFQDGTPFNAAAVKANFDRGRSYGGATAGYKQPLEIVDSVKVVSDYVVQYVLKNRYPAFPYVLATPAGMMISPAAFTGNVNLDTGAVGTGPFKVAKYVTGDHLDMTRNDQYWNKEILACTPKEMHFVGITDTQALFNGALSGQLQVSYVDPNQVPQVRSAGLVVQSAAPFTGNYTFWWDYSTLPALKNVTVRRALMYAVDREALAKNLGLGLAEAAVQVFPSATAGYDPDPAYSAKSFPYDPEKAKQMLAQAGYPNGLDIKVSLSTFTFDQSLAQAIQAQMKAANVRLTFDVGGVNFFGGQHPSNAYLGTGSGRPDGLDWILQQFSATGVFNQGGFPPPAELTALTDKIKELDPADPQRDKLVQQASGVVTDQALALPVMMLYKNWVLSPCVVNFHPPIVAAQQMMGVGWKQGCK